MSLVIELGPELERELQTEAARKGQEAPEYARAVLEGQLLAARRERNRAAIEMLRHWREEPPDLEEAEGYPTEISPLSLREVVID